VSIIYDKLYIYENNPSLSGTKIFNNNEKINKVTKNENKNGINNYNNTLEQSYYFYFSL